MEAKKINKTKKKSAGIDLNLIAIIMGIFGLTFTIYIAYRYSISNRWLFSASILGLFAGLLFESFRVSDNWKTVVYIFIGAYFFSLFNFIPGKREYNYILENHIESWPYFFIILFTILSTIINKNKVIPKLNEGMTLLLTLSIVYWIVDYGFINYNNWFNLSILTIVFFLSVFSVFNSFTSFQLSKTTKLILSIWSTIIMFAFAVDNIIRVFSYDIESSKFLSQKLYIGLQFFFLGISAIYILQNYILLVSFLPSKNGNYKKDLKENIKDHIDRYSNKQEFVAYSLFCIFYTFLLYSLNYKYKFLPRNTMIWLVFLTYPLIVQLLELINRKKITN